MTGTYTVTVAGDLLFQEPASKRISPQIKALFKDADTTIGNLEVYLVDRQTWAGSHGYRNNRAPKEVPADIADMGFDLVAPGEADGGPDEQIETMKYLDAVGIKRPGYGPNLSTARQPAFQELPQGRVAMVAAFPFGPVGTDPIAANRTGNNGGEQAGLNPLRLTQFLTVTQPQMDQLKAIRDSIVARRGEPDVARPTDLPKDKPGRLSFFGKNYMVAEKPGEFRYEMNPTDRQSQVLAIRNAKEARRLDSAPDRSVILTRPGSFRTCVASRLFSPRRSRMLLQPDRRPCRCHSRSCIPFRLRGAAVRSAKGNRRYPLPNGGLRSGQDRLQVQDEPPFPSG